MNNEKLQKCICEQGLSGGKYGFDIKKDNPFRIFRLLRTIADESVAPNEVIDMSRGDPGYGFSPNLRSRRFYSYLLFLDTLFNNFGNHFVRDNRNINEIKEIINKKTREHYSEEIAEEYLRELDLFVSKIIEMAKNQGKNYSESDVFLNIFKYSSVSGGTYHDPKGEEICRIVVADFYMKNLIKTKIDYEDLVFTRGVSDAIGTFFKLMGEEGIGFLEKGDNVLMASPAYAPYGNILENRGINTLSISINPENGEMHPQAKQRIENFKDKIKVFVLIDPNNPTGFKAEDELKKVIVEIAKKHDAIIFTDEVYSSFHEGFKSIFDLAPERTIRTDSRSKIERSTGLRFGDILISKEGNKHITENILREYSKNKSDLKNLFICAKAPGGINGEFMHTTFVTGPSQFMGICHIIFGEKERKKYLEMVEQNMKAFSENLGINVKGNLYYTVFNLDEVPGSKKQAVPAEEKIYEIAKKGVVFVPSNLFFSQEDRDEKNRESTARACLPNLTLEECKKSAQIIKDYLSS